MFKTIYNPKPRPRATWAHLTLSTAPDIGIEDGAGVDTIGMSFSFVSFAVGPSTGARDGATLFGGWAVGAGAGAVVLVVEAMSTSSFMLASQCPGEVQMKYLFPALVSLMMVVLPSVYVCNGLLPEHVS